MSADLTEIEEIVLRRDARGFSLADWSLVEDDFEPSGFVGYRGGTIDDPSWSIDFPDLNTYRELWLSEARRLLTIVDPATLERQILSSARVAGVEIRGATALVRKEFDGWAGADDQPERLRWTTYYFMRRVSHRWKLTGFVGYIPTSER